MDEVLNNYLSCCSCSVNFVNLLLGCTSGLNLAAGLGPVLAMLISNPVISLICLQSIKITIQFVRKAVWSGKSSVEQMQQTFIFMDCVIKRRHSPPSTEVLHGWFISFFIPSRHSQTFYAAHLLVWTPPPPPSKEASICVLFLVLHK